MHLKTNPKGLTVTFLLFLFSITAIAQERPANDSTPGRPSSPAVVKPYKEVVTTKAITMNGFFKVHKIDDRYLFEIPKKMMDRQILAQSRISKGAVDPNLLAQVPGGYGVHKTGNLNDKIAENIIEFTNGQKNKLFLRVNYFFEQSNDFSENGMGKALKNNSIQPLVASFDIKAFSPDSSAVVIDFTEFISSDNNLLFFAGDTKKQYGITTIAADRSYTEEVKAFPINIEIKTIKTYKSASGFNTYQLNTSLVLLSESKMPVRVADKRISYSTSTFQDFDINPMGVDETSLINRWRMEPKEGDMEKYLKGELVEPKKPIVIYIDPATPKKWVPYIMAGVNDWQVAFEKAGFKNAIMAKEVDANDNNWDLENAAYSAIVYKPAAVSEEEQKYFTVNPQTGEILETHIIWNHSEMEDLYTKYFLQCSNTDKRARAPKFDDALMGSLIHAEILHRVGHSLGLNHNYTASSTVPVEKLRNKEWVEANGITPSIMDVVTYNYVAQPEDNIGGQGLLPKIGDYDKWAIEFGYKIFNGTKNANQELPILNKWIIESLAKNPMLSKGGGSPRDPRAQDETLGDNIMKANAYGIKNLKSIMPYLLEWTKEADKGYAKFNRNYRALVVQYSKYIFQTTAYLGGYKTESKTIEQAGPLFSFVNKADQKEALSFINTYFFTTPSWLLNNKYFELSSGYLTESYFAAIQENLLGTMLDNDRLSFFETNESMNTDAYKLTEYFADCKNYIFSELSAKKPIDQLKRSLQRVFITGMGNKITPGAIISSGQSGPARNLNISNTSGGYVAIKALLRSLLAEINAAVPLYTDNTSKLHLADLADRINVTLKSTKE